MDEPLLAAYQGTDYRVRLAGGGWASIRIGQALPAALKPWVGMEAWSIVTAWNPRSERRPRPPNRQAQRDLLACLRALEGVLAIRGALGVGHDGDWREPSLFVVGPETDVLDRLAQRFGQHAFVHGRDGDVARLRLLPAH